MNPALMVLFSVTVVLVFLGIDAANERLDTERQARNDKTAEAEAARCREFNGEPVRIEDSPSVACFKPGILNREFHRDRK